MIPIATSAHECLGRLLCRITTKNWRTQVAKGADIGDDISTAENRVAGWYLPQSSLR
jgi:hypothetical protein